MGYAQATTDAVTYGLIPGAFGLNVTIPQIQAALDARSSYADGKMRARCGGQVPLSPPFDPMIVLSVVHLACGDLLALRGYDQNNPNDMAVLERFKAAIRYFDDVERQTQTPSNIAAMQQQSIASPMIVSSPLLGFGPSTLPGGGGIL